MQLKKHNNFKKVNAVIYDYQQKIVFQMKNVKAPSHWSDLAVSIVASKYFHRPQEKSVFDLIDRVSLGLDESLKLNKFIKKQRLQIIENIKQGLVDQRFAFNSPVWFNCGLYEAYSLKTKGTGFFAYNYQKKEIDAVKNNYQHPQNSACFIQRVNDSLESIYDLLKQEAMLFKYGSGSGTNFSKIRSKYEKINSGGLSSGLISFLEIFDKSAGSIKSGGVIRRAAKMVCLDVSHPEIFDFINWKKNEEKKAQVLIQNGFDGTLDGEVYKTISGQNSNNSVRLTDEFMKAVVGDKDFSLKNHSGSVLKKIKARELWNQLCEAAWICADPGVQFHNTINKMNTCTQSGLINSSNPCSEFMFLDDSACNLASLNLIRYSNRNKFEFDLSSFYKDIRDLIFVQDSLVDYSSYPSKKIAENSHRFRPLGLGFANLGSLLLEKSIPYDSDSGRAWAGAITAAMTGQAYLSSSELAKNKGSFLEYKKNKKSCVQVFKKQKSMLKTINWSLLPDQFKEQIEIVWMSAEESISRFGLRNSQLTLVAPTGTIGLVMDCGTTGIEPDFSLVKNKKMAGGGSINLVNPSVEKSLYFLKYSKEQVEEILLYIQKNNSLVGAPFFMRDHLKIFEMAQGDNVLSPNAHLLMMAAVQPFLSGAISKTINMAQDCTVKDISDVYMKAWKLGLKSVSIYRDQSKFIQPLNSSSGLNQRNENNSNRAHNLKSPRCLICGFDTVKEGSCFKCMNCGSTTSCSS